MSIDTAHGPQAPAQPAPAPPPRRAAAVRQRRRPALVALGIALVAVGGVGSGYLATQGRETHSVVMITRDVPAGQQIALTDLGSTTFTGTTNATTVPAERISSLVGQFAISTLQAGTVLNDAALTRELTPAKGHSIIGIGLKPTQQPTAGLVGGQAVRLVVTAISQQPTATAETGPPKEWKAVVRRVGPLNPDGTRTIDFELEGTSAAEAVSAAGSGAISVIIDGSDS